MSVTYVALLRGVNVGGKNKLPMKELSRMFVDVGCEGVRTYIQSGNVIFSAPPRALAQLSERVAAQIETQFGYRTTVVLRTIDEIQSVVLDNPFLKAGAPEDALHVLFLASTPDPATVGALDPKRSPMDSFIVRGQEVYLQLPNGVARTKLTNDYFDSKLRTTSTGRNWRTVTKLLSLMGADGVSDRA